MKDITLLIKPASSLCQYRCRYCFYESLSEERTVKNCGMMDRKTVEALVSSVFAHAPRSVSFVFQGGEPLFAGLPFLEAFTETVKRHNEGNAAVHYSLQTNGALVDEAYCRFFRKHGFLIGLSLDGTKEMHDRNRLDSQGKSTFSSVMNAASLLRKEGVECNVLTVLTDENARYGERMYRFFRKNGLDYMQFIPCIDEVGVARNRLSPQRYGQFLKRVFDLWYGDLMAGNPSYIRQFENYVNLLCGRPAEDCSMNGHCGAYFVVEGDGSLYPCDFYCTDGYLLGNINDPDSLSVTAKHRAFLDRSLPLPEECRRCRFYALCRGGCMRDREGTDGRNRYCEGYYMFFEYAYDRLAQIAAQICGR